jgi:plastocyanin
VPTAAVGAAATPEGAVVVRIVGRSFQPAGVTVEVGQPVVFVNGDGDEHTATGPGFDTGDIPPGGAATVTFEAPGTYSYVCSYHPEMRGAIEVVSIEGAGTPEPTAQATPASVGPNVAVEIVDVAFAPASLLVPPGTTVIWTNAGVAPHTVSGDFADSGTLEPGQTFSFTFTEPGTYPYRCLFHPGMTGEIVVDPDAPPAIRGS